MSAPIGAASWTSQATVTASLTAFLYEGFTYNAVFLGRVLPGLGRDEKVMPFLVIFNLVWGLALWSYLRVSWADPGSVPEDWNDFVRRMGPSLIVSPGMQEWQPGKATMCRICQRPRPERAHHCALCGVCILRLDHHCPWINNCVGFHNHKYFLLTCFYALLACVIGFATAIPELAVLTQRLRLAVHGVDPGPDALDASDEVAFFVFGALAIFISMFLTPLLYMQFRLALNNKTTIEDNYSNLNPFDQGVSSANLAQIFGKCGPDWLIPVAPLRPILDGISFPNATARLMSDEQPLTGPGLPYSGYEDHSREEEAARRQAEFDGGMGRMWARTYEGVGGNSLAGEALWRLHYHVIDHGMGGMDSKRPSTLDHILGCMQLDIDCEGNRPGDFT